ncbi:MAG TPA: hypothetical protein VFK05_23885 [Polyangiaceae bacterium]|nr:hypothetical protein [Polyangiaceae bacterium]
MSTMICSPHRFDGSRSRRRVLGLAQAGLLCAALLSNARPAHAEDQAAARALFDEGKKLLKSGAYEQACPKLEAASKLYTSVGILLNLGDCYEKLGRSASAWTQFTEARSVAKRTNRSPEEAEANRRLSAIENKLSRLTIRVSQPTPGLRVTRDGEEVAAGAWGVAVPVDPGKHELHAEAEGYLGWTSTIEIGKSAPPLTIDVPALEPSAPAPVAPPPQATAQPPKNLPAADGATASSQSGHPNVLAWSLVGAGGLVAIGGTTLAVIEANRSKEASDNGDSDAYESTKTPWAIGISAAIAGGAAAAVGVVLLVTQKSAAESSKTGSWHATPFWAPGAGGLQLDGTW